MKKHIVLLPFLCTAAFAADPVPWGQADFASELYRGAASAAGKDANVILSSWGVASLFGMLQTGARGDTAQGMAAALRLGDDTPSPDETAATFRAARATLADATNADVAIELSDSLWLAPGFAPQTGFLDLVRESFGADASTTPMDETGRATINRFVDEKTHGRIPELLEPGALDDPLLRMVAVDTIYLKAKWESPFDPTKTSDRVFHAPSGDFQTPFMHDTRNAEILDAPECAALRLPYRDHSVEMLVILPSPSNTLADVEALLGGPFLDRLAASPWQGKASIALPKFEFDSSHDLIPILSPMGMADAFSAAAADFSGIAADIYVSRAIQKANVTVDEEGTEAAAATAACAKASSAWPPPPPPRPFLADRPFLFLIRETGTGLVLFLGRVVKPEYSGDVAPLAKPFYKVKFNANGGSLPKGVKMANQIFAYGMAAKLPKNVFTREGYVFIGWATKKNGPVKFKDKARVKNLRPDGKTTTLYAVWAKKTYKVKFLANGGRGEMPKQPMTYGQAKRLSANAFKKKGCKFVGWAKSKADAKRGKVAYKDKKAVKNLVTDGGTVKLYAVWKQE